MRSPPPRLWSASSFAGSIDHVCGSESRACGAPPADRVTPGAVGIAPGGWCATGGWTGCSGGLSGLPQPTRRPWPGARQTSPTRHRVGRLEHTPPPSSKGRHVDCHPSGFRVSRRPLPSPQRASGGCHGAPHSNPREMAREEARCERASVLFAWMDWANSAAELATGLAKALAAHRQPDGAQHRRRCSLVRRWWWWRW